ncbi:hypothetical protein MCOR02_010044 [Pyricularia oryzae]|nr:hypothetical protein MCOR02_010044 [Pyricularia oryzae]
MKVGRSVCLSDAVISLDYAHHPPTLTGLQTTSLVGPFLGTNGKARQSDIIRQRAKTAWQPRIYRNV